MKFKILALAVLISSLSIAQESDNESLFSNGSSAVQVPLSPEAGTIERYGNLPLNGSTGQMNFSVPFYNISVDGNSWPISLNYNYGGLILEGKQSLNGLGWSTSATGAVTREVRGLPDEDLYGYYSTYSSLASGGPTVQELITDHLQNEYTVGPMANWTYQTVVNFLDGTYDSEVDKYTVNVGGLNFSFKIGLNGEPIFLSKHSNKVIIDFQAVGGGVTNSINEEVNAFTVIDTKGVKYHFETKERRIPNNGDEELLFNVITTWNLDYIEYLNGQRVTFDYTPDTYYDHSYSAFGSAIFMSVAENLDPDPIFIAPIYNDQAPRTQLNRQLLNRITFPKGQIDFAYKSQSEGTSNQSDGRKVYESISLKPTNSSINNTPVKKFEFSYSGNRDYLDNIKRNDSIYFQFDYYREKQLPEFINDEGDKALAQDYWKFYNGQIGNQYAINIPNSQYTANKEPSFSDTRLGALKNIIYPTKGYTQISYCQNQIATENLLDSEYYDELAPSKKLQFSFKGAGADPNDPDYEFDPDATNYDDEHRELTFTEPQLAYISHSVQVNDNGESDDILFEITRSDGLDWYPVFHEGEQIPKPIVAINSKYYKAATYLREQIQQREFPMAYPPMYPNLVEQYEGEGGQGSFTKEFNSGNKILIMPGTYTFKISSSKNLTSTASGSFSVQFYGGFNTADENSDIPEFVNKDVGGIRVSQLKDCPDGDSSKCVTRNFSYNDENGLSTGDLSVIPLDKTVRYYEYTINNDPQPGSVYKREVHQMSSNSFTMSNPSIGTPVYYTSVQEKIAGATGAGYVKREFQHLIEDNSFKYPKRPVGAFLNKGAQKENSAYEEDGGRVSVSETTNSWIKGLVRSSDGQDFNNDHPWSLKVHANQSIFANFALYDYPATTGGDVPTENRLKALHSVLKYREINSFHRAKKVESRQDGMTSSTEYRYNIDQQLIEEKTLDSKGNTIKKEIYYPRDFQENPVFQDMVMVDRNQISQPVLTKSFYNDELMGQTKIDFIYNVNGYKPSLTYSAKGSNELEPRLSLIYDNHGNIEQVDQLSKSPNSNDPQVLRSTAYVWGYNKEYLIAKVENATKAIVDATGYSSAILNSLGSSSEDIQAQLETIRNGIAGSLITSYTYEPLIGIKNITDPRGYIINYSYDEFNRLKAVKDKEGKLLTDYEYGYKQFNLN